jgi:CHASE3 domain sensor protein
LAADVVGYSALMERDEEATYAEFERLKRELIEPSLARHDGRLIKTTGDGAHAEFASPLAAMRCAVEIEDHLATGGSPLRLRVGLNLGDVIVGQDGDLYGDPINIAVRLEGIADPGGILISEKVYDEIEGKLDAVFEDRGEQQLKNISKPVRAYALCAGAHSAPIDKLGAALPLPDKPSIAVIGGQRWLVRPPILAGTVLLALLTATGFFGFRYWQDRQAVNLAIEHARQVLETLDRLRTIIIDLDGERRGYLLTLDPSYRKAYGVSDENVRREIQGLQGLVASDTSQSLRAAHLALIVSAKLREIDEMAKTAAGASSLAALARAMDDIRKQIGMMANHERYLLADREGHANTLDQRRTWLIATIVIIAAFAAAALVALTRPSSRGRKPSVRTRPM